MLYLPCFPITSSNISNYKDEISHSILGLSFKNKTKIKKKVTLNFFINLITHYTSLHQNQVDIKVCVRADVHIFYLCCIRKLYVYNIWKCALRALQIFVLFKLNCSSRNQRK